MIFNSIKDIFRRRTASKLREEMLAEAEYSAEEHRACAEHHSALATMYAERARRIRRQIDESDRPVASIVATTIRPEPWVPSVTASKAA